jgi:YidC/Oxa1 family membrane protein insertase
MMKFYQENKVNPFGSCLPLVLQMPVFISLFYMLRKDLKIDICGPKQHIIEVATQQGKTLTSIGCDAVEKGSAKFLFIPDLTSHGTGAVLIVMLILYVGTQLLSSVLMSVTADRNQRFIMIALPFVFVPFIQGFPAGLLVYWITTNLWTVGQQYVVRRTMGPLRPAVAGTAPAGARAAVDEGGGKATKEPKAVRDGKGSGPVPPPAKAPPPSARKKRKRSGRRR